MCVFCCTIFLLFIYYNGCSVVSCCLFLFLVTEFSLGFVSGFVWIENVPSFCGVRCFIFVGEVLLVTKLVLVRGVLTCVVVKIGLLMFG